MHSPGLKTIFTEALVRQGGPERAAYLDEACRGDAELRARVGALLRDHEQIGRFLGTATGTTGSSAEAAGPGPGGPQPGDPARAEAPSTCGAPVGAGAEVSGTVIGPYRLLQPIGEGGMGTVYMAEQRHPVRRAVALKLIKAGMDGRHVLARFGAERQALALMDHPNIAKVFDAGTTDDGRPYFVMELVKGVPITRFCDERRLTLRERLELAIPVCQAVQHAHQKGIIHRDIKPSNVLIALYDGKPVPKVIDFGVAKATGPRLTDQTLYTEFGTVVGTLEYMSPEQAELNQLDIDTRSDIYSLGVLLYELLTGSTPLGQKRVKEVMFLEVLRVIREEESPRPSTRLSTTEELPSIAACRQVEPRKLSGLMRGELDWIVMKALEKDRNRRYETANGLAADLRHYLDDQPVQACPPSAWYRFHKFARRNKSALATTFLLGLALLVAVGGIAGSIAWAMRERAAVAQQAARDTAARQGTLEGRISQALDETQSWYDRDKLPEALATVKWVDALLASDNNVRNEIRQRADRWRAELTILVRLEELGLLPQNDHQIRKTDTAYSKIFFDMGINIDEMPVEEAGRRIRACLTWKHLAESLDRWAGIRHQIYWFDNPNMTTSGGIAKIPPERFFDKKTRLLRIARAADSDDLRSRARLAVEEWDLAAAEYLAGLPEVSRLPSSTLRQLSTVIYYGEGDSRRNGGVRLLLDAQIQRPGDFGLNAGCANYFLRMQPPNWVEAAHYWSIAIAIRPEDARIQGLLISACVNMKKFDEAIAHASKALALAPNNAEFNNVLAWLFATCPNSKLRDPRRAVELAKKGVSLAPEEASYWNTLGVAEHRQGDWKAAIEALTKSEELASRTFLGYDAFFLAMAHWHLGDKPRARGWYDKAVQWMEKNQPKNEELNRFRAEAAALLEVSGKKD